MKRWIVRIALGLAVVVIAAMAAIWTVLAIPYFSHFRTTLISQLLSDQVGQPVLVNGDARVSVARVSRVHVSGVQIPSTNISDLDLATLNSLEFDINLVSLLDRRIDLNNLFIDGLRVDLLKQEDGTTSYEAVKQRAPAEQSDDSVETSTPAEQPEQVEDKDNPSLLSFLRTRTVALTNVRLIIDDAISGFEYDFELEELSLNQLEDALGVTGRGQVNGQPFKLDSLYPDSGPFTNAATFSSSTLTFDGDPTPVEEGGGYTAELVLDVGSMQDLFDVLKLKGGIDGNAQLRFSLNRSGDISALSDIDATVNLEKGQLISLTGDIENLAEADGFDLQFDARLHPEGQPPANAADLADLKLTRISTQIISEKAALELENLILATNAFEQGLDEVGPVSIGRIRRTEEGTLALQDINLQAGPLDKPFLVASGNINNILQLKALDLEGKIDAPATLVLSTLGDDVAEKFGGIQAEFQVDDATGVLSLTQLSAKAVNTDVWALEAEIAVGDVTTLNGSVVDVALELQDGAEFLSALKLEPVDTGPLGLDFSIRGKDGRWAGTLGLGAGQSELTGTIEAGKEDGRDKITTEIISEFMDISDLKNALAGVVELSKIGQETESEGEPSTDVELQPLVLPETDEAPSETKTPNVRNGVELQPLVIEDSEEDKIVDANEFLRETDIYGLIDFKEISGIKGITRVSSDFVSEGGKARLGPLEFNYGGAYFNFEAAMDVVEAPDFVSVAGATSGWDLADLLSAAGVEFDANGALSGQFSVGGNVTSVDAFVNSMAGSASIAMSQGKVATSLLELAGLGIFPWLFSREIQQGYTNVVCVNAPVNIAAGAVSFDSIVAETESVQLVARGSVDWVGDSIQIRAEPRKVNSPLSRSAWPFEVNGKLSDPRFKLDIGGSRSRRADGADQMPANRQPCKPDILQLQ